jgi:DNA mismatch repair protein MutL
MSRIRILPEVMSNQIAAGEVVERPASVVKELVENALDAGASRIQVGIEKGGRTLIQVADDGCGMSRDDALMAIERYATSKLREAADLFAIRTLGFRGEALPSIAAVSRFTLVTREVEAEAGTEVRLEGGSLRDVRTAGAPPGTQVTVAQLFYNTPARRKFLKTVTTELGHISDTLTAVALAHPQVGIRLDHDGRAMRQWPSVVEPVVRVADVLGRSLQDRLVPLAHAAEGVALSGWVAPPDASRTTARGIYIFVNGRWVRDRGVYHGLMAGFGQRLMKGQFPLAVLFLKIPFEQVDVNVHPTKHEVRFAEPRAVHDAVALAVSRALTGREQSIWPVGGRGAQTALLQAAEPASGYPAAPRRPGVFAEPLTAAAGPPSSTPVFEQDARPPASTGSTTPLSPSGAPLQNTLWRTDRFTALTVLAQLHGTYLVCQSEAGMVLIDQHAAHERIYYEQLSKAAAGRRPPAQTLLMPETVEVGFGEAAALEPLVAHLVQCGLEVEPFGGTTFAVKAVPAFLAGRPIEPLLRQIAEQAAETGSGGGLDALVDNSLKLMACHGAVRGRQHLSETELKALLAQLDDCDQPHHCPHGRPTWILIDLRELDKRFGRTTG